MTTTLNQSKTESKTKLDYRKTLPGGKIEAVQSWATGWQVLVFDNAKHFNKCGGSIAVKSRIQ